MGLAERRAATEFETNLFPAIKAGLQKSMAAEIPIEVDWVSISNDLTADRFADVWPKLYFKPLTDAFASICQDEMGKASLAEKLKKIHVANRTKNHSASKWAAFDAASGTLSLDHYATNVDSVKDRTDGVRKVLEKAFSNLEERRAAKAFETARFPALKADLLKAAAFEVPIEVDWKLLSLEGAAKMYEETWVKIFFTPLIDGLESITKDQMGKDALKAGLKKILVTNTANHSSPSSAIKFAGGTLLIDHHPTTNAHDTKARATAVQKVLEKAL